ncbi:F0F1 ATP synthase subunit epsilon [Blochmannia endosymbiont of Colobopsis nipponica]|uniref:F0F1 ATP synthase subunit epsilon n=1 Tax=Blochmannia endosymbiont of Colobopsis nipponica TaxID=2681987 RepID=UPI00178395E4|nr:F0F1 ATP synthase subunit epsilon [Blochmannia endosymbiont of Colobopsis nipponica]QOI10836.1 F0F1 ATP synthase subunit epsilon [Blochmannia endosymbiont of Colobopsis nipponica]
MCGFTFSLNIISAETKIFSDIVRKIRITGSEGEMGILPGHAPLLALLKSGMVCVSQKNDDKMLYIYISGGILEVQPDIVTVLADTAIRGEELDEKRAVELKCVMEEKIRNSHGNIDFIKVSIELSRAIAQLRVIELMKNNIIR